MSGGIKCNSSSNSEKSPSLRNFELQSLSVFKSHSSPVTKKNINNKIIVVNICF